MDFSLERQRALFFTEVASRNRSTIRLDDVCFDKQLAFIRDPAPFKTAVCSRRAGKTVGCAFDLLLAAKSRPRIVCLYITLSRANAKRIIWPELKRINTEFRLGGVPNESDLSITFSNSSVLYVSGAKHASEIEKFRGLAIYKVYVDEAQAFRSYIQELIDDVLSAALFDYNGILCLTGTPGPVPAGYFYDCSKNPQWSHHAWTMFDNPWLLQKSKRTPQELLERELNRRGVTVQDPSIQREMFGRWIADLDALVLKYNAEKNHWEHLPQTAKPWQHVIGVDLGFDDSDALAVIGWNEKLPGSYLREELVQAKQGITELAQQLEKLIATYNPLAIVMDTGGLGKKIAEEIRKRFGIPVKAAEKQRKFEFIELLNDAMRTGKFFAKRDGQFAHDSKLLEWDRDKQRELQKYVVRDTYHSDICLIAGTQVQTSSGPKSIESLSLTDLVLTRNGFKRVLGVAQTSPSATVQTLTFSNGSSLTCTSEHKVFVVGKGFCSANALQYGDRVITLPDCCSAAILVQREVRTGLVPVFDITVESDHEFFANGILVKNCDAVLYGFRESLHWLHEPEPVTIEPGSPKDFQRQVDEMEREALARLQDEHVQQPEPLEGWGWG